MTLSDKKNVQGIVVDGETGEPLPFAHVYSGDIRTITNVDGEVYHYDSPQRV